MWMCAGMFVCVSQVKNKLTLIVWYNLVVLVNFLLDHPLLPHWCRG